MSSQGVAHFLDELAGKECWIYLWDTAGRKERRTLTVESFGAEGVLVQDGNKMRLHPWGSVFSIELATAHPEGSVDVSVDYQPVVGDPAMDNW